MCLFAVAPRAGAWIEISEKAYYSVFQKVAPRAGAWIEISSYYDAAGGFHGRSPCGSVD